MDLDDYRLNEADMNDDRQQKVNSLPPRHHGFFRVLYLNDLIEKISAIIKHPTFGQTEGQEISDIGIAPSWGGGIIVLLKSGVSFSSPFTLLDMISNGPYGDDNNSNNEQYVKESIIRVIDDTESVYGVEEELLNSRIPKAVNEPEKGSEIAVLFLPEVQVSTVLFEVLNHIIKSNHIENVLLQNMHKMDNGISPAVYISVLSSSKSCGQYADITLTKDVIAQSLPGCMSCFTENKTCNEMNSSEKISEINHSQSRYQDVISGIVHSTQWKYLLRYHQETDFTEEFYNFNDSPN
jgi:hypothetical protein